MKYINSVVFDTTPISKTKTKKRLVILGDQEPCGDLDILWELETADFGDAAYSGVIYLSALTRVCFLIQSSGTLSL